MRKVIPLFLFALAALMMISPVLAQAPTESYTSQDGSISLSYPHGWVVNETDGSIILMTGADVQMGDNRTMQPGEGTFSLQTFNTARRSPLNRLFRGTTVIERLQTFVSNLRNGSSNSTFTDVASTTIGAHPGAVATGTINTTGNAVEILLEDFGNGGYGLVVMVAAPNGMELLEPKMLAIAASMTYTPPSLPAAPSTSFNLGSLALINIQDAGNLMRLATINAHTGNATTVAISPDGQMIASGGSDGAIHLWNASTGELLPSPAAQNTGIQQLLFTPDGARLISAQNDGTVRLWDVKTGDPQAMTQHDDGIFYMAISPDGKSLAYISYSGNSQQLTSSSVWLLNLETGGDQMIATLPDNHFANSIAFSPDGKQILYSASGNNQASAWLFDTATQREIRQWSQNGDPIDVFFTADSQPMVSKTADDQSFDIALWNPQSDSTTFTLSGHQQTVYQTVLSADRSILGTPSFDGTVRLWNVQTGTNLAVLPDRASVLGIAFSPDGRLLVTSDADGRVMLWGVVAKANI